MKVDRKKLRLTGAEKRVMDIIKTFNKLHLYVQWNRSKTSDRVILETTNYNPGYSMSDNIELGQISTWTTERILNSLARKGLLPKYTYVHNGQTYIVADIDQINALLVQCSSLSTEVSK